jgi:hypothetical protein
LEPPRLIFEQPPPRGRSHLARAGKIAAGTLAVSVLAAGGVEVLGSSQTSQDDQLGLSRAFAAASAPAGAKLASVPGWLELRATAPAKLHVAVKRAHAATRHAKQHPKATHSSTHPAHAAAPTPSAHRAVLVASTTPRSSAAAPASGSSSSGATHSTSSASHPTSWSSHYSWHSSTSSDGTTTKVTTTSHSTTVGGHTSTSTHTHTTVTPAPSHSAASH